MRRSIALLAAAVVSSAVLSPTPASATFDTLDVDLVSVVTATNPIALAVRPISTGDDDLYIAEQDGKVQRWDGVVKTEILDISSETTGSGEQGLLGITFSPAGDELFVNFTDNAGDTIVRGYAFAGVPIVVAGYQIIKINQPYDNHNGGNLAFGPDDHLYIGMGDGGRGNDPGNRAQNNRSLLGKMLRIDPVPGGGYTVPDNPYRRGRKEIWAKGLRNPWRFSFDSDLGDLWIGDVGQSRIEEIDRQPASSDGGQNYGWRRMEGTKRNVGEMLPNRRHTKPVFQYTHNIGCSVTGGYVYRGSAIPDLVGAYVFADFCAGDVRGFPIDTPSGVRDLGAHVPTVSSFGQDQAGELYVLSLADDTVYKIVP
jgi:hypothetical protein